MSARRSALCVLGLVAALEGCTSPQVARDDAHESVRRDLDTRLGTLPHDEPGVVAEARVRALLEGGVDEDEAVRIALLANRSITASYAELGLHSADLAQASLWANPILDVGLLFFDDGTEIDLGLSQSFVDVFLRPGRTAVAEHELEAARARVARGIVAHAFRTRRAHVSAVAARTRVEMETRRAAAAESAVDLARRLHDAGSFTAREVALEEAELAVRLLERSAAESAFLAIREELTRELGLWGDAANYEIAGALRADPASGLDLERVESRAISASLDLAERRAHAAALARAAGVATLEARLPGASLGVGAMKDHDTSDWGVGPRGSIGIPLGDSGGARRFAAESALAVAEADHYARAVLVRSYARTFRDRLRALDADARFARDVHVPAERRVVEETLRNYNAMQVGAFDVLRAQGIEIGAERHALALLAEAWKARLDLEELYAGRANDERIEVDGQASARLAARTAQGGH